MKVGTRTTVKKSFQVLAWLMSILVILGSNFILVLYSLNYQTHKTKQFFLAFFFGLAKKTFFNDAVFLWFMSATWVFICRRSPPSEIYYHKKKTITPHMAKVEHMTTRLNSMKRMYYFYMYEEDKSNEHLIREAEETREHYKEIVRDLLMFMFYMVTLFLVVMATKDNFSYYTKETISNLITKPTVYNKETHSGWRDFSFGSEEVFEWLNSSFINNINDGQKYTGAKFEDPAWVTFGYAKVLGVARLRQQRREDPVYDPNSHSGWHQNLSGMRYVQDFWRISEPWVYQTTKETDSRSLFGKLYLHPGGGYVAQLGRTKENTQNLLDFLHKNRWHDSNTKVIFIEFCLYNVDTNIFIIVNIVIEETPYQFQVSEVHIEPVKLLIVLQNLDWHLLIPFYIYLIMVFIYAYSLVTVIRNHLLRKFFSKPWNIFDAIIILLSALMLVFYFVRSDMVEALLLKLEEAKNNEFVSFEPVLIFEYMVNYISAFLICLTIVRLWKLLHFSTKFRIYTVTLKRSAMELWASFCCMAVLFIAFGLAVCIINGNHSVTLKEPFTSITQSVAYGLGFGTPQHAGELFKGGKPFGRFLGFVSYMFLVCVCAIFLTNMFVAVACIYMSEVQNDKNVVHRYSFSFWKFVQVEYGIHHLIWSDKKQKGTCSKKKYPYYGD